MGIRELIEKKRDGRELSGDEIDYIIQGYVGGQIPDYQMSALLMAIFFRGMSEKETEEMTLSMAHSGEMLDLSAVKGCKADKHSTGGVGDKTTLVLAPMLAACGLTVAKMSGRGLGHTGGTIDKLESIPGFSTRLSMEQFTRQAGEIGLALTGQTENLVPADKKIYNLRDVTGTVEQMSLIASSIMSKKLASGADVILLDVKTGSGAFMKEESEAIELARQMTALGLAAGKETVAIVTDMDQPLGHAVGNALEVREAIAALHGEGPKDLMELCYVFGTYLLEVSGRVTDHEEARGMMENSIKSGAALQKFAQWVEAQGGDPAVAENTDLLPRASIVMDLITESSGFIEHIDCESIGRACERLGGGRSRKEDAIDLSVGVVLHKKVGDRLENGDVLATMHGNDLDSMKEAKDILFGACHLSRTPVEPGKLIRWVVSKNGIEKY
ncbi:MAG: thymidine phosphorylase [Lachnospiraceae bacterium]|nr:thymidine phosphorylase [Lachnospiraceae bacterium]